MQRIKLSIKNTAQAPDTVFSAEAVVVALEIDGRPFPIQLLQKLQLSIDAESLIPQLQLTFIVPLADVEVDLPAEIAAHPGKSVPRDVFSRPGGHHETHGFHATDPAAEHAANQRLGG